MKAEIKDKDKNIVRALSALDVTVDSKTLELVLNVAEYVQKKGGSTTIGELIELQQCVNLLYEE